MAITGVMRIGMVALRVLDLEAARHHYCEVLGLIPTASTADRLYMKAWDEHDHHSLVLRQSDHAGVDYCAFKVRTDADLDRYARELAADGVPVHEEPPAEELGRRIVFDAPTGHRFALYAHSATVGNGLPVDNPDFEPDGLRGIAVPRLEHVFLYGPRAAESVRIFCDVLGFTVTEKLVAPDGQVKASFLACNTAMHDVGFVEHDEPGKFHHVSYWIDSPDRVMAAANILGRNDVPIDEGPTQHGIGRAKTIYFWDPSGNRNEVFCGSYQYFPDRPTLTWDFGHIGKAISYPHRRVNDTFMSVLT